MLINMEIADWQIQDPFFSLNTEYSEKCISLTLYVYVPNLKLNE